MAGGALLAASRLRADVAGITGAKTTTLPAATSVTEAVSHVLHGESGELGYLFDNLYTVPASSAVPGGPGPGVHGGTQSLPTPAVAIPQPAPQGPADVAAPGSIVGPGLGAWDQIKARVPTNWRDRLLGRG
jgi:hypothetical protein